MEPQPEFTIHHFTHPEHPLTLASVGLSDGVSYWTCGVCREHISDGQCYSCRLCDFDAHIRCTKLPEKTVSQHAQTRAISHVGYNQYAPQPPLPPQYSPQPPPQYAPQPSQTPQYATQQPLPPKYAAQPPLPPQYAPQQPPPLQYAPQPPPPQQYAPQLYQAQQYSPQMYPYPYPYMPPPVYYHPPAVSVTQQAPPPQSHGEPEAGKKSRVGKIMSTIGTIGTMLAVGTGANVLAEVIM